MKWEVRFAGRAPEVVESESAYVNPVGTLLFLRKAAVLPLPDDAPKKKKGWPRKAATVTVRGFNADKWDDFILVGE